MANGEAKDAAIYWWVNQGRTYDAQNEDGLLWAPKRNANGAALEYWDALRDITPGDRILHYARGHIRAIGTAATSAIDSPRPADISGGSSDDDGLMIRVNSTVLPTRIALDDIDPAQRTSGPLDKNGEVRHGYLCRLDKQFVDCRRLRFPDLIASTTV